MPDYYFERECRTSHSESFLIEADGSELGRVDIHYTPSVAYATLCVPPATTEVQTFSVKSPQSTRYCISSLFPGFTMLNV